MAAFALVLWWSIVANFLGLTIARMLAASLREHIVVSLRTPRGLAALCICWLLFLLAAVFASTLLISWARGQNGESSSMDAWPSARDLVGWTDRRHYCLALQLSAEFKNFSEDDRFFWKLGTACSLRYIQPIPETELWSC